MVVDLVGVMYQPQQAIDLPEVHSMVLDWTLEGRPRLHFTDMPKVAVRSPKDLGGLRSGWGYRLEQGPVLLGNMRVNVRV